LLDAAGHVCLIDLGLCAFVAEGSLLSDHCGTRSYMSPEQTYGSYSFPSDWWSLGVVILVQLCGLVRLDFLFLILSESFLSKEK